MAVVKFYQYRVQLEQLAQFIVFSLSLFGLNRVVSTFFLANTFHVWVFNFCARKYIARFDFQLLLTNYKSWKYTTCHVHSIYSCILKLFLTSILILEGYQIHMQLICISCLNYIWIKSLMYKNYKHVHK